MGLISRTLQVTAAGSVATVAIFFGSTRNDLQQPMQATDPVFQSPFFKKFNPNNNPTTHDLFVRRVPLDKIRPELLEKKGKLVEAFCAGVWGGLGKFYPQYLVRTRAAELMTVPPNEQATSPSAPISSANTVLKHQTTSGTARIWSRTPTMSAP